MTAGARNADVIVAGGGPGGSVLAWELARRGVRVVVLERSRFPREKVCGDYVEPRGLRILQQMGCLERLEASAPLPITHSATFVDWNRCYAAEIPFYGVTEQLPPHGYIIPRDELDNAILETAEQAGATVDQETLVTAVTAASSGIVVERLRRLHPRCVNLELCSAPIGGIVRTYGGAGPNHFDGGVLIGDAGSFVDPMTGEGITPAAESALLAEPVLQAALEAGRFDARQLAAYERAFRAYFDPAMTFLDLCAAVLRNRSFARPWLKALARGCELAQADPEFARTGGSYFGGLEIQPFGILGQMWVRIVEDLLLAWPRLVGGLARAPAANATTVGDLIEWQAAWSRSLLADPLWHLRWTMDVQRKSVRLVSTMERAGGDPRAAGLLG